MSPRLFEQTKKKEKEMFKNIQFIFIGQFRKEDVRYKHSHLKSWVIKRGGTCVVNCSVNTNFVVLPNNINEKRFKFLNNKQIAIAQKMGIPIVHFNFLLDCIKEKGVLPHQSYLVVDFNGTVKRNDMQMRENINKFNLELGGGGGGVDDDNCYSKNEILYWKNEYVQIEHELNTQQQQQQQQNNAWHCYLHDDGRTYYYNAMTGYVQWDPPLIQMEFY